MAPLFPLCPQYALFCGFHFSRTLIHSQAAALGEWGSPTLCQTAQSVATTQGHSACHSLAHLGRGKALTQKMQAKLPRSHRRVLFINKGWDVTKWWQDSSAVSFPSSLNNPLPHPRTAQSISLHHLKIRMKPTGIEPNGVYQMKAALYLRPVASLASLSQFAGSDLRAARNKSWR